MSKFICTACMIADCLHTMDIDLFAEHTKPTKEVACQTDGNDDFYQMKQMYKILAEQQSYLEYVHLLQEESLLKVRLQMLNIIKRRPHLKRKNAMLWTGK